MKTLYRYSCLYRSSAGAAMQDVLEVPARHPAGFYWKHFRFGVHTGGRPWARNCIRGGEASPGAAHEWLARDRRIIQFFDAADFSPVLRCKAVQSFTDRMRDIQVNLDHLSVCDSLSTGATFLLNEPSGPMLLEHPNALARCGLVHAELPVNVSPYCMVWTGRPGALPEGRSFLVTDERNEIELQAVMRRLHEAAARAPAWNDLSMVRHV